SRARTPNSGRRQPANTLRCVSRSSHRRPAATRRAPRACTVPASASRLRAARVDTGEEVVAAPAVSGARVGHVERIAADLVPPDEVAAVSPGDAASMASCTGVPGPGVTTIVPACAREAEKMATKASTTRVDMGDAYLACFSRVNAGLPPLTRAPPVRHHLASTR